jgi:hypothetical protein
VVLLIIAVGLLNIGLGCATAFYLGYGPPGLREAWEALGPDPGEPLAAPLAASPDQAPPPAESSPAPLEPPAVTTTDLAAESSVGQAVPDSSG